MSLDKSITALEMKKYELRVKLIDLRREIEYLKEKDELQTPPSLHERESTVEYAEEKNELSLPPARDEHEDAEQLSRPEEHDGTMTCRDSPLLTGCEVVECSPAPEECEHDEEKPSDKASSGSPPTDREVEVCPQHAEEDDYDEAKPSPSKEKCITITTVVRNFTSIFFVLLTFMSLMLGIRDSQHTLQGWRDHTAISICPLLMNNQLDSRKWISDIHLLSWIGIRRRKISRGVQQN